MGDATTDGWKPAGWRAPWLQGRPRPLLAAATRVACAAELTLPATLPTQGLALDPQAPDQSCP